MLSKNGIIMNPFATLYVHECHNVGTRVRCQLLVTANTLPQWLGLKITQITAV